MSRYGLIIIAVGLLLTQAGCRNRSNNQYAGGGLFAGSPTISAPATYSLNIPSVARNQPYYVPGQGGSNGVSGTLNPNTTAPTANNNQAQLNGWRPSDNNGPNPANSNQPPSSAPTTFANNASNVPNGFRTASATALPGSGVSYTDSTNYQSTRVNETLDQTRLPATDASTVRAPARNFPTGGVPRLAQAPMGNDPRYPATFNAPASAGMSLNSGQPVYNGNLVVGNGGFAGPIYRGQPTVGSPTYLTTPYTSSQPAVLAQSTTNYDPYNGGQLGWRDREIGSNSMNR